MSEAQIIEFLKNNSEFFTTNNIILTAVRTVGWLLVKGLSLLLDSCITLYDWTFGLIDITRWQVFENYLNTYRPLIQAVMMASLVMLGFMYLFGKNKKHNIVNSILILMVVMTASTTVFTELNRFSIAFKDAALSGGSSVNGTELIRTNLYDLYYIDSRIGLENLKPSGKIPQASSISETDVDLIDIGEILSPETEGLSEHAKSILKKRLMFTGDGGYGAVDVKDGVAWTDFGNTYYYRYTFRYGTYYLTALAAILIYICLAYKNTRIIYEIFVSRMIVAIHAANLSSPKKAVKILEGIRDGYFALCFTAVSLKSYFLFVEYVNAQTHINGLGRGIIILFIAFCVIDGANILEKLTGVDAGLSSMTGKMIAMYHMMRGAGQTVQQARQFHLMKEQRDAMRNMKTMAAGGGTGAGNGGDTFQNMDNAMEQSEQNGQYGEDASDSSQMEGQMQDAQEEGNNYDSSFEEMSESIENEMGVEQSEQGSMEENIRMENQNDEEIQSQDMEQAGYTEQIYGEEHSDITEQANFTEQTDGMERGGYESRQPSGLEENAVKEQGMTAAGSLSGGMPKKTETGTAGQDLEGIAGAKGFHGETQDYDRISKAQAAGQKASAYGETKNMFDKWKDKTTSMEETVRHARDAGTQTGRLETDRASLGDKRQYTGDSSYGASESFVQRRAPVQEAGNRNRNGAGQIKNTDIRKDRKTFQDTGSISDRNKKEKTK